MEEPLRQRLIAAAVVFVVAVLVSVVTSGVISDIAFVIYVIALVVLAVLIGAYLLRLVRSGAGRMPKDREER